MVAHVGETMDVIIFAFVIPRQARPHFTIDGACFICFDPHPHPAFIKTSV